MADKIACPICETIVPASAKECPLCGASLAGKALPVDGPLPSRRTLLPAGSYDSDQGEDDLYAPDMLRFPWWSVAGSALFVVVLIGIAALLGGILRPGGSGTAGAGRPGGPTAVPTLASGQTGSGLTAMPTLFLPTLTPTDTLTATPSPTATPGPCEQVVGQGDTLITLATRCGHRDLAIIDEILRINGLRSAESLQLGQVILIPWPTPTPGPTEAATIEGGESESGLDLTAFDAAGGGAPTPISEIIPTATLQPGVMWYVVQPQETIIEIAVMFDASVEILSQLNPEVTFSQCDFGERFGGGSCIVQLVEGQRLRVPAPTPTPTLSPTPSGSETPTPTPTPTFNAPALFSPGDRFLFRAHEIVTLRWTSSGVLGPEEVYLVTVTDETAGVTRTLTSRETMVILPDEWQPADGQRHRFTWAVAVGPSDGRGGLASVTFSTPSRLFFWDSP